MPPLGQDIRHDVDLGRREERRFDLDWIRVGAFALLILYHLGLYYATAPWLANSPHENRVMDALLLATHPWRMCLLFLVSGAATAYMASRIGPAVLCRKRSLRLLLPLVFGTLVVVPPQIYYMMRGLLLTDETYLAFWINRYLLNAGTVTAGGKTYVLINCVHLWFVAYLWVYTMLVGLMLALGTGALPALRRAAERHLSGTGLLFWPVAYFALTRLTVFPLSGEMPGAVLGDWYGHLDFFACFLLGFLVARPGPITEECVRLRRVALGLALGAWALQAGLFWTEGPDGGSLDAGPGLVRVIHSVERWTAIVAALGYGRLYLNRGSAILTYLTGAVFTYYIVHQTVMVVAAHHLENADLPVPIEAAVLLAVTVAACGLTYEVVRRIPALRPFFGINGRGIGPARSRPERATGPAAAPAAAAAAG
ncbi:MAG: acetyltransferase [Enterovirga sp.]|jgi:glucan biosynthesis protein C|nr:acetyltransferase [Enterovirga sp.]